MARQRGANLILQETRNYSEADLQRCPGIVITRAGSLPLRGRRWIPASLPLCS
jgi:hypothetical protein